MNLINKIIYLEKEIQNKELELKKLDGIEKDKIAKEIQKIKNELRFYNSKLN